MRMVKPLIAMVAVLSAMIGFGGDSAPFRLDTMEGTRVAREVELISYSTAWENGTTVRVAVDGVTLKEVSAPASGDVAWNATNAGIGTHALTHTTYNNGVAGKVETVTFQVKAIYTVTFAANGGSLGAASATRSVAEGTAIGTLPTPTRTEAVFAGWWTAPNGGTQISASTTVEADITLYAIWLRPNCYGIAFDPGVENAEWSMDCQSVELGKVAKLNPCAFTAPAGKRFAGWRRKDNGRRYDDGVMVFNLVSEPGAVIVLEAVWEDSPR